MMSNSLFLHRLLIITENGLTAYDQTFHKGVNIIRGNNSSGKSTITHFIFFVLGGDFIDFVPEAKMCSTVYAQVEMNNAVFTIKRELEKDNDFRVKRQSPMYFYWGNLDESLAPPKDQHWQKYGYKTTVNYKSFSNVIFDNLDLPIVKGDSNITFHQILRLLYIDQDSPTNSLFYYENFDSQITRETVADLLLGVYNEELYQNKKRLIIAQKELENIKNEIRVTKQFFPDILTSNSEHIKAIISNKEKEINEIELKIIELRKKDNQQKYDNKTQLQFQILNDESIKQRNLVKEKSDEIEFLENEIEDSEYFIETLNSKIIALKNSIQTRDFLGSLPLDYCPECLTKLKTDSNTGKCKLCKEEIDNSFGIVQARRMEQEIGFQIVESIKILETNKRKLLELTSQYESEIIKLQQLQRQVNSAIIDVKSVNQEIIDKLIQDIGFIEGESLQYRTLLENAELYENLLVKENEFKLEISFLNNYIYKTELEQFKHKEKISEKIREEGVYLLNHDLERQDDFKNANEFYIDFANNIAFLSNKYSKYSASSNFYLKVSARFAVFLASLSVEKMRYPRFIFADNMEDKGIEKERAQNLQKILIDRLSSFEQNSYQMIYTTSYITEELNEGPLVVGDYYTKENPSLKNVNM